MLLKYVIRNLNFLRSEKSFLVSYAFDISFTSYLSKMHIAYTFNTNTNLLLCKKVSTSKKIRHKKVKQ